MRRYHVLTTVLFFSLATASCGPNRQHADQMLATSCQESIRALSHPADQIEFKKSSFKLEKTEDGQDIRIVMLSAAFIHDHGVMVEKSYTCAYTERRDIFGYRVEFYYLEKDGSQYGNYSGRAMGELDDLLKIHAVSEKLPH